MVKILERKSPKHACESTSSLKQGSSIYVFDLQHPWRMCTRMQLDSSFSLKIEDFQSLCEYILSAYAIRRLRVLDLLRVNSLPPE